MNFEEEKKIRQIIKQGLKKKFSLSETDLIAPTSNAWDKIKDEFKTVVANLMSNLETDEYDDASGDITKAISMLKTWKKKIEKDIFDSSIKENENKFSAEKIIMHNLDDNFIKHLIPNSCKMNGPDDEGTYTAECKLQIPKHYFPDLETATFKTREQLESNNYVGPGQPYSKSKVYAIKSNSMYYILGFEVSGGYDI